MRFTFFGDERFRFSTSLLCFETFRKALFLYSKVWNFEDPGAWLQKGVCRF